MFTKLGRRIIPTIAVILFASIGLAFASGQREESKNENDPLVAVIKTDEGYYYHGILHLAPSETFVGVKAFVDEGGTLQWQKLTPEEVGFPEFHFENANMVASSSPYYRGFRLCDGVTNVEDPIWIDVNNVHNGVWGTLWSDNIMEWIDDHDHDEYTNAFSFWPFTEWYVSAGPTVQGHGHQYSNGELILTWRQLSTTFENYIWGDDALGTWATHWNNIYLYADGSCDLGWSIFLSGEDSHLLTAEAWIGGYFLPPL